MDILQSIRRSGYFHCVLPELKNARAQLIEFVTSFSEPYLRDATPERTPTVVDIKPVAGQDPHSFQGADRFDLHTDYSWLKRPPRYATLLCIHPESAGGGEALLVDGFDTLERFSRQERHELREQRYTFDTHRDSVTQRSLSAPILVGEGPFSIRFRRDLMQEELAPVPLSGIEVQHPLDLS
jgi:alpha-ketoglutarate-dependent taurine dioxygenase